MIAMTQVKDSMLTGGGSLVAMGKGGKKDMHWSVSFD